MSEVFLSYARQDEAAARRVAKALQDAGFQVWWDADLPAHRAYSEVIEARLNEAKAVIVLWSANATKSQWVRAEADLARTQGKLVQARLDHKLPPIPFNQIQCADLKGWRGNRSHGGWAKLHASVDALVKGNEVAASSEPDPRGWWNSPLARWAAAILVVILVAAVLGLGVLDWTTARKPVVAVLPFESLDRRDESLVAGIWEDTRQAIGRNQQLVVLGPNSSEELASKGVQAASKVADYLLQANVRSGSDRIRVTANLIRAKDDAQVWSETFERPLDDVFQMQMDIARQIEGKIRGRLAEGGGVLPENIATSGEVYAIYSNARAQVRSRQPDSYGEAVLQLRRVVEMDPNFAPGWATLAVAERITHPSQLEQSRFDQTETYARRAIALAPNLAAGHGALALTLNLHGPAAEAELRRAVALDPNDFEAINWLASLVKNKGDLDEAMELYARAAEIEPLWWPAILNKVDLLLERRAFEAADAEVERLNGLGAVHLATLAGMNIARSKGDLSRAADLGLVHYKRELAKRGPQRPSVFEFNLWALLLQMGYSEEIDSIGQPPPFAQPLRRNEARGLDMVEKMNLPPSKFFTMSPLPMAAGRVYLLNGRGAKLAELYRSAAASPDKMATLAGRSEFVALAPYLALALQGVGDSGEARRLLDSAEKIAKADPANRETPQQAALARIYAAQGRKEEALTLLAAAVNQGWLPEPPSMLTDIALDPALAELKGDRRFLKLREQILGHLRKERAELGPLKLN